MTYSVPNDTDDVTTRLAYTLAAEFIYRLDSLLESIDKDAHADSAVSTACVPVEAVHTVHQCAQSALDMLGAIQGFCEQGKAPAYPWTTDAQFGTTPDAARIIERVTEVLDMRMEGAPPNAAMTHGSKAHLTFALAGELFATLEELAEAVALRSGPLVTNDDVGTLRGYIDAAMGMVYDLDCVSWQDGSPAPAQVVIGVLDNAYTWRLECAGYEAELAAKQVFNAFIDQLRPPV